MATASTAAAARLRIPPGVANVCGEVTHASPPPSHLDLRAREVGRLYALEETMAQSSLKWRVRRRVARTMVGRTGLCCNPDGMRPHATLAALASDGGTVERLWSAGRV
jgi:hypothetical protein